MLKLNHIYLSFDQSLIEDSCLDIPSQQITVISGESGCGKSSLLYEIAFMTQNASKEYCFLGQNTDDLSLSEKENLQRTKIAFVFQNTQLFACMTLMENIEFFSRLGSNCFDESKAREYLTDLDLFLDDNTDISTLSGGEMQRLAIVCALMKETPLIILDEPTAYLDQENKEKIIHVLNLLKNKYNKAILIASHDQLIKDNCDCLYEIVGRQIQKLKCKKGEELKKDINCSSVPKFILNYFYKKDYSYQRWSHYLIQFLLTIIFVVTCFFTVFLQVYQEYIEVSVDNLKSTQIVLETYQPITNQKLKDINYLNNVQVVKRLDYIVTDDNYLLLPYLSSDYFLNHIQYRGPNTTMIYANYEVYRQRKTEITKCFIDGKKHTLSIDSYLDVDFEDYSSLQVSNLSKVIYLPYEYFSNLTKEIVDQESELTSCLIQIDNLENYEDVLIDLQEEMPQSSIIGNANLMPLLDLQNKLSLFIQGITLFIMGMIILVILLLKINSHYRSRFSYALLEVNGVPKKDIRKMTYKKELRLLYVPLLLSFLLVNILFAISSILTLEIILTTILYLTSCSIIIFLLSCIVNGIITKLLPTMKIIKKSL